MTKIAIVGFGRMGLSHLSILRGLLGAKQHEVTVYDTSFVSRMLAKLVAPNIRTAKNHTRDDLSQFDYILFCTPPFDRYAELENVASIRAFCFFEKPVVGKLPANGMSGYVLQHAPLVQDVEEALNDKEITLIRGTVKTPMDFSDTTGWRSTKFGAIGSEFFGHAVTMALAPMANRSVEIDPNSATIREKSVNALHVDFELENGTLFKVELEGGRKDVRKTTYMVEYHTADDVVVTYSLFELHVDGKLVQDVARKGVSTTFYLRGFEFTQQMQRMLGCEGDVLDRATINKVEELIGQI